MMKQLASRCWLIWALCAAAMLGTPYRGALFAAGTGLGWTAGALWTLLRARWQR